MYRQMRFGLFLLAGLFLGLAAPGCATFDYDDSNDDIQSISEYRRPTPQLPPSSKPISLDGQ